MKTSQSVTAERKDEEAASPLFAAPLNNSSKHPFMKKNSSMATFPLSKKANQQVKTISRIQVLNLKLTYSRDAIQSLNELNFRKNECIEPAK